MDTVKKPTIKSVAKAKNIKAGTPKKRAKRYDPKVTLHHLTFDQAIELAVQTKIQK